MREALDGKVKQVVLSQRLKTHPVCLSSDGEISLEMEKVLNAMPNSEMVKAQRVLKMNAYYLVFKALQKLYPDQKEKLGTYASLLYTQALLIEGVAIEDPVGFSNQICGADDRRDKSVKEKFCLVVRNRSCLIFVCRLCLIWEDVDFCGSWERFFPETESVLRHFETAGQENILRTDICCSAVLYLFW